MWFKESKNNIISELNDNIKSVEDSDIWADTHVTGVITEHASIELNSLFIHKVNNRKILFYRWRNPVVILIIFVFKSVLLVLDINISDTTNKR